MIITDALPLVDRSPKWPLDLFFYCHSSSFPSLFLHYFQLESSQLSTHKMAALGRNLFGIFFQVLPPAALIAFLIDLYWLWKQWSTAASLLRSSRPSIRMPPSKVSYRISKYIVKSRYCPNPNHGSLVAHPHGGQVLFVWWKTQRKRKRDRPPVETPPGLSSSSKGPHPATTPRFPRLKCLKHLSSACPCGPG